MKFIVGVIVGILLCFVVFALSSNAQINRLRAVGNLARSSASDVARDACRKAYLEKTSCFQIPHRTAEQCEAELKAECD